MAAAPVSVLGLATAVPDHVLEQSAVARFRAPHLRQKLRALSQARRRLRQCRHRAALFGASARMVRRAARLERAHASLSRRRRRAVRARGGDAHWRRPASLRATSMSSSRCRRPASPRRAWKRASAAQLGFRAVGGARAGVRARLRRRRLGTVDRRAAGPRRAGRGGAGRRRRAVHAGVSRRPRRQGRRDLLGAVRRRRRRGGAARRARAGRRSPSARPPSTPGRARSTSWAGRSIRSASAWCCRARCRALSSSGWRRRCAVSSMTRGSRRRNSSAIPAAPRCSTRSRPRSNCRRARCATSARCCAATAICRRRACCSCSSARCKRGLRGPTVLAALGPGFTASFLALEAHRSGHG